MPKLLFVYNPHSGKGQIKNQLMGIVDIFVRSGYDVSIRPTQGKSDAYEYVTENARNYDRVVVAGGDGTLNEVMRAVVSFDETERPEIGYIPAGTTNDFAATLGLSKRNMLWAAKTAVRGKPLRCDTASFNGTPFNYVAGFGAFTDVSYDTPQETKNVIGHAAYVLEGIKRLATLPSYHVNIKYDGGEIQEEVFLCLIMNATSVGGFISAEKLINVDLCDGVYEMLVFRQPANILEFQSFITGLAMGDPNADGCTAIHSSHFEITSEEIIKWTLDGEFGGETNKAVIDVNPLSVTYIIDNEE